MCQVFFYKSTKIMNTTGEKLKKILSDKNLTQADLSSLTGISRQTMSSIISNASKPNWEFLTILNTQLNVNLNWLIADNGKMYVSTPNEALKAELRQEFEELLRKRGL